MFRPFKEVTTPFVTGSGAHLVEKHPPPVSLVVLRYHPARASTNPPVALSTTTCHDRTWAAARVCYRGARSRVVWKTSGLQKIGSKNWRYKYFQDTVDGRNPAPVEVGSLSQNLQGTSQVVQDFFHEQYVYCQETSWNMIFAWRFIVKHLGCT